MYTIGKLYRWVGQVGTFAYLNGTECTVIGAPFKFTDVTTGREATAQHTDSRSPEPCRIGVAAEAGDLAPVDRDGGERSVFEMFRAPDLEPA